MEENDVIKNVEKKDGNYISGIIGALIGGFISAIPWVLVYIELNLITSLLAILISLGALKGYQIFKGKISPSMKPIILIVSLIVVIVCNILIIPYFLALKNDVVFSLLFENSQILGAFIKDLIISLIFAGLGMGIVISKINNVLAKSKTSALSDSQKELIEKSEELQKLQIDTQLKDKDKKELDIAREAFNKLNAFSANTAVSKEEIIEAMNYENAEKLFKKLKSREIIKKKKGKYFYNKNKEVFFVNRNYIGIFIFTMAIVFLINFLNSDTPSNPNETYIDSSLESENAYMQTVFSNDNSISIEIPYSWSIDTENTYGSTILLKSKDHNFGFSLINTSKADFDIPFSKFKDLFGEYVYSNYSVEEENDVLSCKVNNYNAYTTSFYTIESGYKLKIWAYCIETENNFIEIYAYSAKSKADENEKTLKNIINTLKEI